MRHTERKAAVDGSRRRKQLKKVQIKMEFNLTIFLVFMLALTYDVSAHAVQCKFTLNYIHVSIRNTEGCIRTPMVQGRANFRETF